MKKNSEKTDVICFTILILFSMTVLLVIFLYGCDQPQSNNPEPTPTPGYFEIVCGNVRCEDASTIWDFKILAGAYFTNSGTVSGSGFAWLKIQQPYGVTIATWSQEIYLNPGNSVWVEHIFSEPEWNQGTVYCSCDKYY